ncbi:polyamine-modulated factor 1 [Thalassophryne amazonica]|uniref:polyamine-modulated factor 1 n=1 Tax=Thalassophryne amazonica TaxID=390379 RepID=UPI001470F131|nr:polyamine-modulated factor 1 [Thalassophryne amazonica]
MEKTEEAPDGTCDKESTQSVVSDAAGDLCSSGGAGNKPCEENEVRWSRIKLFEKAIQKSLDKFIGYASFNRFASTFRPLYNKNPQRMESIHKQFIEVLRNTIQEDISRLIEEARLKDKLNELDKLDSAATNNPDPAWRPSGVPEEDFCSFFLPYYQKQEAYLRRELKNIKAENAALAQKVQTGRECVDQTEQSILSAVDEWKASVTDFERLASSLFSNDVFKI